MLSPIKHKAKDVEYYETKSIGCWVLWNLKQENVESYETKTKDVESYKKKQRTLSPLKLKMNDVESYKT